MKCGLIIPSIASHRVVLWREGAFVDCIRVGWSTNQRSRCLLRLLKSSKLQTPQRVNYPTGCLWLGAALPSLAREPTWIKNERIINREPEVAAEKRLSVCEALWELSLGSLAWLANDASKINSQISVAYVYGIIIVIIWYLDTNFAIFSARVKLSYYY